MNINTGPGGTGRGAPELQYLPTAGDVYHSINYGGQHPVSTGNSAAAHSNKHGAGSGIHNRPRVRFFSVKYEVLNDSIYF